MGTWLGDAWQDIRLGVRGFAHDRAFSASVVLTLALGIGLNAAMFGVADRLLLGGPAHVREPERVKRLQRISQPPGRDIRRTGSFGYVAYDALKRNAKTLESVAAYSVSIDGAILGRGLAARRITRGETTSDLFGLLGVTPTAGRFFTAQEDDPVAPVNVAVIGYGLWQQEFGGRPDAVGKSLVIDNTDYTVVGVAPRGFTGPDLARVDVWLPESLFGRRIVPQWTTSWNGSWLSLVARLKPGVSTDAADAEATAIFQSAYTGKSEVIRKATIKLQPLVTSESGTPSMESRVSVWLAGVAGVVLLVACANVINLVLAHGIRRRREMAVRSALGAGRGRLVRLLLAEGLTLAAAGGAAGLVVAYVVGTVIRSWLIPNIEWPSGPVNARVFGLAAAIALVTGVVVGLLPAVRGSKPDVSGSLKTGVREGGGRRSRTRATLTVAQAALSAMLLVGAGLFVVSLERIRGMDLGLEPDRVLTFSVLRPALSRISDEAERTLERARRDAFYPMVLDRLGQRTDIEAASLSIGLAFSTGFGDDIRVPGRERLPQVRGGGPFLSAVTADYFRTVGTRILRGRAFTPADRAGTTQVAIVNETMAAAIWPGEDAIGKCFHIAQSPVCTEIVGVAANTRQFRLKEDESMAFYMPLGQEQTISGPQLLVRPRGDADAVLSAVRQELVALDPSIVFVYAEMLQDKVDPQIRPWKLGAMMFSLMGILALVVAAVGLYSVMAYFVTHRTHEIGVRLALGARPADVAGLVMRGGLALVFGGVAVGFGLAILAARFVEPLLFDTSPREPVVFGGVAIVLIGTAIAATIVPAARARRINPVDALRSE